MLSHSLGECYLTTILIIALLCFTHHSCTYRHAASGTLPHRHRATFVQSLSFVATSGCPSRVPIFHRSSPFFSRRLSSRDQSFLNLCCGRLQSFRLNGYLRHNSRLRTARQPSSVSVAMSSLIDFLLSIAKAFFVIGKGC